jgi:DNA-binding SARP family transcriptional activator
LIEGGDFTFRKHFHLTFDFDLNNLTQFGYICRFFEDTDEICLMYFPHGSEKHSYFDIVLKGEERLLRLPFSKEKLEKEQWHKLELSFFLEADSIMLSVDSVSVAVPYEFQRSYSPKLVFGFYKTSLTLPAISIKDVKLENHKENVVVHFPFNECTGTKAIDATGQYEIKITKPDWIAKQHFYWKQEHELITNPMAGNCFIPERNEIYLVGTDSILVYNIQNNSFSTLKYSNKFPLPHMHYDVAYNPQKGTIDAYVFNEGVRKVHKDWITSLDLVTLKWQKPHLSNLQPKHWHHNNLFIDGYNYPVIFGGYGQLKYFNQFITYNPDSLLWQNINFSGVSIPPRFLASLSQKVGHNYYLYGGFGNQTGEQELGGYNYYDLYKINTKEKNIKKLWEMPRQENEFVGANTMVFDKADSAVFVLCYEHHLANTHLFLQRFDLKKPGYTLVSDSIPVTSLSISSKNDLFYSEKSGKLIAALREDPGNGETVFRYYSLLFPPIGQKVVKVKPEKNWFAEISLLLKVLVLVVLFVVIVVIVIIYKKVRRKKKSPQTIQPQVSWDKEQLTAVLPDKNVLLLFGAFKAINKKGQNITHLFSPRLLQLLYLILVSQLKNKEGITSDQISLALWPEKEPRQSKNIRSVTFNHLRNAIEDIEGIEVIYENKGWKISVDDNVFIDLVHFYASVNSKVFDITQHDNPEFLKFLAYCSRGNFGKLVNDEWLDNHKFDIDSTAIEMLFKTISECWNDTNNNELGLFASSAILKMAPFNEDAIQYKLKFLTRMGKFESAEKFHKKFSANFEKNFDQAPSWNFLEVINNVK